MSTVREDVLRDAIAACQRIVEMHQSDADEAGRRHERRTSPLLICAGAKQCVTSLTAMLQGFPLCASCRVALPWNGFTLCRGCHADWVREKQTEITAP